MVTLLLPLSIALFATPLLKVFCNGQDAAIIAVEPEQKSVRFRDRES